MSCTAFLRVLAIALFLSCNAYAQEHEHHPPSAAQPAPDEHAHHAMRGDEAGDSEHEHVPPDPPATEMRDMPAKIMIDMMGMDDAARFGKVIFDQLDWRDTDDGNALAWDAQAWYGSDYNKLWLKTEGERIHDSIEEARVEVLWDRIFSRWWSVQTGVRHDFGEGPTRNWLAVGVEGLAPYFFEIEATAYFGEGGRTAARFSAEYELLLTQRLVLQPEVELSFYGKDDPENGIGSGFSEAELGLRLRYEIRREIAPYIGVAWVHHFGDTADLLRGRGDDARDLQVLAGVRIWF